MSTNAIQHQSKSFPLGATLSRNGANFSVFAKHSTAAQPLLFDRVDDPEPSRVIDLDPRTLIVLTTIGSFSCRMTWM